MRPRDSIVPETSLLLRWAALLSIGLVLYLTGSRALRGKAPLAASGAYAWVVAAAAVGFAWLATQKHFWVPVLGPTQIPPHCLAYDRTPTAGMKVATDAAATIAVADPRAVGVIYWAADPAPTMTKFQDELDPNASFESMTNGGVARVINGTATLNFRCPRNTELLWKYPLPKRMHYRIVFRDGNISGVRTFEVTC